MKFCIVYYSKYGAGKEAVRRLGKIVESKGHEVSIASLKEAKPKKMPRADVYVFSAPTYIGSPAGKMKRFLKKAVLPDSASYGLMTTYSEETKAIPKMSLILENRGMTGPKATLEIRVPEWKGPPEDGFEKKLEGFVAAILE